LISPFVLQIISAISGGITDLSFDSMGYTWQIMNCILTACYSVCRLKACHFTSPQSLILSVILLNCLGCTYIVFSLEYGAVTLAICVSVNGFLFLQFSTINLRHLYPVTAYPAQGDGHGKAVNQKWIS